MTSSVYDWVGVLNDLKRDCDGRRSNIYFVLSGDSVKIGFADDVERRLKGLQTGSPEPLVLLANFEGYTELEKRLHNYFADEHLRGEWFVASDRIFEFAAAITEAQELLPEVSA